MKLGTRAEKLLAKHIHEVVADPERFLRDARLPSLEPYLRGVAAAFRAEHGRDPWSDSPWNSWGAYEVRRGFGARGAFVGLAEDGAASDEARMAAFRRFLAFFNRFRTWAQGRACTALLEDARSVAAVRKFFNAEAAKVPRTRLAARQYVLGSGRKFDAVVFRADGWLEDEADGRDNRVAIAIVDGA